MSTRSYIGIEHPSGTVTTTYCHSDGYVGTGLAVPKQQDLQGMIERYEDTWDRFGIHPSDIYQHKSGYYGTLVRGVGVTLDKYYQDREKVESLVMSVGREGISVLEPKLHPTPGSGHEWYYENRERSVTVASGRDRGRKESMQQSFGSAEEYREEMLPDIHIEVLYLYTADNTWLVTSNIPRHVPGPPRDTWRLLSECCSMLIHPKDEYTLVKSFQIPASEQLVH